MVSVLILNAVMGLRKKSIVDKLLCGDCGGFLPCIRMGGYFPCLVVLAAAILGIAVSCGREAKEK